MAFHYDSALLAYFADTKSDTAGDVASAVSKYGDWPPIAGFLILLFGGAVALRSPKMGRLLLVVLLAASLGGLAANGIRLLAGRARPSAKLAPGWYGPHLGVQKLCSFPSAHTAVIAGGAAALATLVPWSALPGVAAVVFMAWARMRVGAHHLSDVTVGAFLGGWLGMWVVPRIPKSWPPARWFERKDPAPQT